jgi:signal transduction histidine kinase
MSNDRLSRELASRQKTEERGTAGQLALETMHEIRNPLEALSNLLYLALEKADEPEAVRSYLRLAQEQAAALNGIAGDILGFAKSSRLPKSTSLVALAEAGLRIHQKALKAKRIHVVKELPEDLAAEVHGGEILQVVSNLISNALDALPVEGTLYVRLRRCGDEAHFVIADNGHGMPREVLARIFEPFFTTKEERGTGLGLTLSRTIVEHHGGRICARSSVRPGRSGTAFKISLPLGPTPGSA